MLLGLLKETWFLVLPSFAVCGWVFLWVVCSYPDGSEDCRDDENDVLAVAKKREDYFRFRGVSLAVYRRLS